MSEFVTMADVEEMRARLNKVLAGRASPEELRAWGGVEVEDRPPSEVPRGTVSETDKELFVQVATADGMTEVDALRALVSDPDTAIESKRQAIEQRRATLQNLADERARREFEASEEGRRLKAAQLAEREADEARLEEMADRLLHDEQGLSREDLARLTPAEKIGASGVRGGLREPQTAWERFERGSVVNEGLSGGTVEENAAAAGPNQEGER